MRNDKMHVVIEQKIVVQNIKQVIVARVKNTLAVIIIKFVLVCSKDYTWECR